MVMIIPKGENCLLVGRRGRKKDITLFMCIAQVYIQYINRRRVYLWY